jgi:hypothetical protein
MDESPPSFVGSHPDARPEVPACGCFRSLEREQVQLLDASAPAGLAASAIGAATLAVVEWNASPRLPLLGWLAYAAILTWLCGLLVRSFRQAQPDAQAQPRWKRLFLAGAALAGLGWGSTMLVVLSPASILHQIVLVFMLGGILASAVFTHSPRY